MTINEIIAEYRAAPRFYTVTNRGKTLFKQVYAAIPFPCKSPMEAVFAYENGLTAHPTCGGCGKETSFNKGTHQYSTYCSSKCAYPFTLVKKNETCLDKYGTIHPTQNEELRTSIKKTMKDRYGVEHPYQVKEFRDKATQTHMDRYGVENPLQHPPTVAKLKLSNLEKYGVYDHNCGRPDVQSSINATMIERYGVPNTTQNPVLLQKVKNSNLASYWGDNVGIVTDPVEMRRLYEELGVVDLAAKLNSTQPTVCRYLRGHGIEVANYRSYLEENIGLFLKSLDPLIQSNKYVVKEFEVDFVDYSRKIAFDIHGLYWHSESVKSDRNYHLKRCTTHLNAGYTLYQILENEWLTKREIVESRIKNILGRSERGCAARHTTVREISWREAKNFLNRYHLQGAGTTGNVRVGCFDHNDTLIGVMTFSKGRKALNSAGKGWELLRYASDFQTHAGMAGKLLKFFETTHCPKTLVSYADKRWSNGGLYTALDFKFVHDSAPGYWYTNDYRTLSHRYNFTKAKTIEMGGDPSLTEWQNMQEFGYDRIWDCGNSKWIKNY